MTIEADVRNEIRYPSYTRSEVLVDTAAHVTGIAFGLVATIALLITASHHSEPLLTVGAGLYGLGLLAMLTCSAGYNLWPPSPTKELWRRLDHAAIFLMIAGTYTPLLLNTAGGSGYGLLVYVWAVALFGAILKIAFPRRWETVTIALYLGLGWSIVVAYNPLLQAVSMNSLYLIGTGGIIYSVGVIFHLWDRLPYQNAIWHWLVLIAAACHYFAIFNVVALAAN